MKKSPIFPKPASLIRPTVYRVHAYVPGEQPKVKGLIKLNTNENPYPPSAKVLKAVKAAVDGRLRLYPDAAAERLRAKLAALHGCEARNIIIGNGSDELLALAARAFVEPLATETSQGKPIASDSNRRLRPAVSNRGQLSPHTLQYLSPGYSLYPVLADIHGAQRTAVPLDAEFGLPKLDDLRREGSWDFAAALSLITTPNAPGGRGYTTVELESICRAQKGVVLLDEAYVDFARENAFSLSLKYPHVLVCRTFSKAYSLCFQRVGYMVGHHELISALHRIRDSYNVNGLGQIAAEATLDDLPYYRKNHARIIHSREWLSRKLADLGFAVFSSQTNFVLVRPPRFSAHEWLGKLRSSKILVRWFDHEGLRDYLRISVGTDEEVRLLVDAAEHYLRLRQK